MEFQDKLDGIWKRISDEEFLANRGTGGEVRYYVFDYDASMELIVRDKIRQLRKQNNPEADGFEIVEFDLYQMVLDILNEKGYLEKCIKFEKTKGRDYLYTAVAKLLLYKIRKNHNHGTNSIWVGNRAIIVWCVVEIMNHNVGYLAAILGFICADEAGKAVGWH